MSENCTFLNCPHSRRYEGTSLFKIPNPEASDSEHTSRTKLEARVRLGKLVFSARDKKPAN